MPSALAENNDLDVIPNFSTTQQNMQCTFTVLKRALNVHVRVIKRSLNAWIEHHSFNVCFYHTLYMRMEKHAFNV